jgi:hypothetical protein
MKTNKKNQQINHKQTPKTTQTLQQNHPPDYPKTNKNPRKTRKELVFSVHFRQKHEKF